MFLDVLFSQQEVVEKRSLNESNWSALAGNFTVQEKIEALSALSFFKEYQ